MYSVGQILFIRRAALAVGACLLMVGCGQRGELYLPDTEAARQRTHLPGLVRLPAAAQTTTVPATTEAAPVRPAASDSAR